VYLVLEEAPISVSSEMSRSAHLLALSARGDFALERATFNLYNYLKKNPGLNLADAAYTLQVGRRAFAKRRALVCRDNGDAVDILERRDSRCLFSGDHIDRSLIFMFPGQGTEYSNMGWELYRDEPVFKNHVDRCAEILKSISGHNLIDALYSREPAAARLDQAHAAQLALFTIEYALARLWMDWGCRPRGMIGHGIGEYVAATISGIITVEDALRSLWARCLLMQRIPEGRMASVLLGEKAIRPFLGRNLWLAAVNTPSLCVASGTTAAIHRLEKELAVKRIPCIPLKTQWAFHSGMLDDILESFARVMEQVPLKSPQIPLLSCVTGQWITPGEAVDPAYWVKQMHQTVHFSRGVRELLREPNRVLLEVGPGDTLRRLAKEHTQYEEQEHRAPGRILTSLRRSDEVESDQAFLLKTLGQLWVSGVMPDWESLYRNENRHRIPLPTYPFEREHYWIEEKQIPREKLLPPEITGEISAPYHPRPALSVKYTPPTGKIEKFITAIWEEVFGIRPIGIYDNFFELGGHSLSATIVTSRN
jgi:phthiocerol/phenolphthiocerol synthesis type-I polyketide synthase E